LGWSGLCFIVGLLIGALPLLIYNLGATPGNDSIHVLLYLQQLGTSYTTPNHIPFVQHIIGAFMIALPAETGYNPLCSDKEYLPRLSSVGNLFAKGQQFQCTVQHGSWSLGISILWMIALLLSMLSICRQLHHTPAKSWSHEQRQYVLLQVARSMLLIGAALAFTLYVLSPSSAFQPLGTTRYLTCLLLSIPAVLWPLWSGMLIPLVHGISSKWRMFASLACSIVISLFLITTFVRGTIDVLTDISTVQKAYTQQEDLIHELLRLGARRIYSDYDTCYPLIFQSHEQIICSDLKMQGQQLQPGLNRYRPYLNMVRSIPHPAYIYRLNSPEITILDQGRHRLDKHYQRLIYNGYVIYLYMTPK
jgi:hypothetical protein